MQDKPRNVMYLRLSREDGDVEGGSVQESCSIASQRQCLQSYIASQPDLVPLAFEEIVDDGCSGTSMRRPGVARLLRMAEAGEVGTIIVRDLSRFSRSYLDAGHYLEFIFPACGVRFISVNDHFDSRALGEDTGGLELAIRNLINDMYSRDISRKIRSAVDLKKMSGEYVYGTAPFGYRKGAQRNTIEIDEPAAAVVRRIFAWAAAGVTIAQIARRLNDAGETTPSVHLAAVRGRYRTRSFWTYDSVRNILNNHIYTGDTEPFKSRVVRVGSSRVRQIPREQRIVLPGTHEAIIDSATYEQARRAVRPRGKGVPAPQDDPLTSLLVCGCCGNRLSKGRSRNRTWRCTSARYGGSPGCAHVRADDAQMRALLLNSIRTQARLLDARLEQLAALERAGGSEADMLSREIRRLSGQIERLRAQKLMEYERYAAGEAGREAFLAAKEALAAQEERAAASLSLLEERLARARSVLTQTSAQKSGAQAVARAAEIDELTPGLVRELLRRVMVYPGGRVSIEWSFRDELLAVLHAQRDTPGAQ